MYALQWLLSLLSYAYRMKTGMLSALEKETEKQVRSAIAQFVGTMIKHDSHTQGDYTANVLGFVFNLCGSNEVTKREFGTSIFATLTATAPDQFIPHMDSICGMISAALLTVEQSDNMATPVISNVL